MLAYRSNNGNRRNYLGEAFMTTHSFLEEKLVDPMLGHVLQYANNDSDVVASCYRKVSRGRKGERASTAVVVLPALTKLMPVCWPRGHFRSDHNQAISASVC